MHSFLRLARALWWIGVRGCKLIWTSFYDDFITFSQPKLIGSTSKVVKVLFKVLSWVFAEKGDKAQPFGHQCAALGVYFDLAASSMGKAVIANIESRRAELCEEIKSVLSDGQLGSKRAQRLRGRMQFAESQLFGRMGKRCLRVLADFSEARRVSLTRKDVFFLKMFCQLLEK